MGSKVVQKGAKSGQFGSKMVQKSCFGVPPGGVFQKVVVGPFKEHRTPILGYRDPWDPKIGFLDPKSGSEVPNWGSEVNLGGVEIGCRRLPPPEPSGD